MAKPLTTDIKPPSDLELECIAHAVSQAKKVVVIIGAGASTAAGIPDFRSKGGLYEQGIRFEASDLGRKDFMSRLLDLREQSIAAQPTRTHKFIARLQRRGQLLRCYSMNLDMLESKAGLSTDTKNDDVDCITVHGSLQYLRCPLCYATSRWERHRRTILKRQPPLCPHCSERCHKRMKQGKRRLTIGHLRPDIVLTGEFHRQCDDIKAFMKEDIAGQPDLLLIIGTSLSHYGAPALAGAFSRAVRAEGGKVVYINASEAPLHKWREHVSNPIRWDCDSWVQDLERRRPGFSPNDGVVGGRQSDNVGMTLDNPIVLD